MFISVLMPFSSAGGGVIALLLAASEISYRLIEIPGIRFGQRINRRRKLHQGLQEA